MRNLLFAWVVVLGTALQVYAPDVQTNTASLTDDLNKNIKERDEARQRLTQAEKELEKRKNSGASVEQLSQVQLSVQALKKLSDDAQKRVETIQNKMLVLQARPQG